MDNIFHQLELKKWPRQRVGTKIGIKKNNTFDHIQQPAAASHFLKQLTFSYDDTFAKLSRCCVVG